MTIDPPLLDHSYVSRKDPTLIVYVANVNVFEDESEAETAFTVECCDPAFKGDIDNADGFEMTSDVWVKHDFTLVQE
jgi:hypothetical protein